MNFSHSISISGLPAASSTATPAAAPAAARGLRTRFADIDRSPVELRSIELRDGILRIPGFRHFHEGESPRLAGVAVRHDVHPLDVSKLRERSMKFILRCLIAEIPHENIGHRICSFSDSN